ncbi:MAG: family 43 glycosylhydrolase [Oscillospiraceae bacterium]|nr:family 43 glycosylhydrolase [Oscillospiraceae bacterium]
MKNRLKRIISFFLASSILMSITFMTSCAVNELPTDELLVYISFDENGTGSGSFEASKGGIVKEYGNVSYSSGCNNDSGNKALYISENAPGNYLELPEGILAGKTAATFSFWLKPGGGWPFMTTPVGGKQDFLHEKYLGMLASPASLTAERYNNSGARLSSVGAEGDYSDWIYVTVVFEENGTKLYINGRLSASDSTAVDVKSLMTSDASTWIGHGNWGDGEGFSGKIDDFRIYGKALSKDEISSLADEAVNMELIKTVYEKNRLEIYTDFYKNGTAVFQVEPGETVSAHISVKNYRINERKLCVTAEAFDADNNSSEIVYKSPEKTLAVLENAEFTAEITADNKKAAYYKFTVKDITDEKDAEFDAGYLPVSQTLFPPPSPSDSNQTTSGAHDPTIFKDPKSGHYFAYSTHNVVFESEDLIHWTQRNFNGRITVPESAEAYIEKNIPEAEANGTYWAPDIYYSEGDEYPYWFYVSVSCGLGGRNSVIGLVKSKSPRIWDDEYRDCGVVLASSESSNSPTNAIDTNIFTDSDGKVYFIWGSFWQGIHMAELDTETGRVKGVDYTDDKTLLASSNKVGARVFSTPKGVVGPEGPFTVYNEDTGYRYMFTSYGWLGTNYNVRIARTNKTFEEVLSDNPSRQLLDHNNRPVGMSYSDQVKEGGSLGELWGYKISGSFRLGDGIEYVGSGHNSAFRDDDGSWYFVQHCRKVADAWAYLQVKKMMWTEDGWPVISPLVYAGEQVQDIPETMLYGTWDLSSVGHTILDNGVTNVSTSGAYKGSDLPVHSSEIILQSDGTLGNDLGTWSFDGGHTVTISFAADGNADNYEFYRNGDTVKMFVLTGYDKDAGKSALVLTGTDQACIAHFAKKSNACAQSTKIIPKVNTIPTVIKKSSGGNPVNGCDAAGNIIYAGDPAAFVEGDTVYLYAGHDTSNKEEYVMPEWICFSSKDMINWNYEGPVMKAESISWASDKTSAWASQAAAYNGKYYLYYCTWDKTSDGKQSIGVAVADSPTGPFIDKGTPLVKGTFTTPQTSDYNDIDPTVWIETIDGAEHRYLAWGNGKYYVCELNEDMISVKDTDGDGNIKMGADIKEQEFKNIPDGLWFTEAPWLYRRKSSDGGYAGKYYTFGAFGRREQMGYAVSDSPYGPWEFGGIIMKPTATSNTNHPSVIDFGGKTYFIYHNGALSKGSGFRRSICIQELKFGSDGKVFPMEELSIGLTGTASRIRTYDGRYIGCDEFSNPSADAEYPISKECVLFDDNYDLNTAWEITKGKYDPDNENYISIQSVNKPGLYIKASDNSAVLTQDSDGVQAEAMTFKTVKALDGSDGVSFESITEKGKFLFSFGNKLILSYPYDLSSCSFNISETDITNAGLEDLSVRDGKITFSLKNAKMYETADIYIAEYNDDNALINVHCEKTDIKSNNQPVSIDYTARENGNKVCLMVWNNMYPIVDKKVID